MEILKKMINIFAYVIAGTTISATLFITVFFPKNSFGISLLWEIIAISAVCALGNLIYHHKRVLSKRQMKIRMTCHYLYINAVVIGGAFLFGWIMPGLLVEFLVIMLLIAVVYVIIAMVTFRQEQKIAKDFNRRLRNKYQSQENEEA